MTWYVHSAAATDTGRVREANEDAFLMEPPMFAVADGMGGHAGGEVASALALETLRTTHETSGDISAGVREANLAVHERQAIDPALAGMGTTLTAMIIDESGLRVVHVGDSRAYLLRIEELTQITEDHTLVRELVQEGQLTEEQARVHPQRSMLTRAVGIDPVVDLDEAMIQPRSGDRFLLCSDGLTGMVTDEDIRATLVANEDPQNAADKLVALANDAGGADNTTVVVLDLSDLPPAPAGTDPKTGEQTTTNTFADEIVIHKHGIDFRSRGFVIALVATAVVVGLVLGIFLAVRGG